MAQPNDGRTLTPEQEKQLTLARLALQNDVRFATLEGRIVHQVRALMEVQADTPLGRALTEIERRSLGMVALDSRHEPPPAGRCLGGLAARIAKD